MIEIVEGSPEGLPEIRAPGRVSEQYDENVLVPTKVPSPAERRSASSSRSAPTSTATPPARSGPMHIWKSATGAASTAWP